MTFAEKLKSLRKQASMSQEQLAEKLGVSSMTVSHWRHRDNGVAPTNRVIPIFNATGVTPHELRPDLYPNPTDGLPVSAQDARA